MKIKENVYNALLATQTPLWLADHDFCTHNVEMPISGDALTTRGMRDYEGK